MPSPPAPSFGRPRNHHAAPGTKKGQRRDRCQAVRMLAGSRREAGLPPLPSPTRLVDEPPDLDQLDLAQIVEHFRIDPSLYRQVVSPRGRRRSADELVCREVVGWEAGAASWEQDTGPIKPVSTRYVLLPGDVHLIERDRLLVSRQRESDRLFGWLEDVIEAARERACPLVPLLNFQNAAFFTSPPLGICRQPAA